MKKILLGVLVFVIAGGATWFVWTKSVEKKADVRIYRIGLLYQGGSFEQVAEGFKQGMNALVAGASDKKIEYVFKKITGTEQKDFDVAAEEIVGQNVDLIFAVAVEPIIAAKKATAVNQIPVVLGLGGNPALIGLVESVQKPGGNLTGMTWLAWELSGKRLEILLKIDPRIKRVVVFGKKGSKPMKFSLESMRPVAENLGITLVVKEVEDFKDLEREVGSITRNNAEAIYYAPDPFISRNFKFIINHSLEQKLPTIFADEYFAQEGALASYGGNFQSSGKQASRIAGKILFEGKKPEDLPIESVVKIDLAINLDSAKKIGLAISSEVLSLAQIIISKK